MPYFPNPSGGPPIQADTNPNPAGGSYGYYSDPSYNGPPPPTGGSGGGGGGGGGGTGSQVGPAGTQTVGQQVTSALGPLMSQSAGFSREQLAEQIREFDAQLAWAKEQMEKIGLPQLAIQQQLADMQVQQMQSMLTGMYQGAPTQAAILQQANLSGMYNGAPTEQARQFNQTQALQYLTQASQFAASDPFQLSDFMRGASQQTGMPQFLQNLQNNVTGGAAGSVGPNAAPALTLGGLNSAMANGAQVNPQTDPALAATGNIYTQGANRLATGSLESLSPTELQTLQQGIAHLYGAQAAPAFMAQYQATRPQQTATRTSYY